MASSAQPPPLPLQACAGWDLTVWLGSCSNESHIINCIVQPFFAQCLRIMENTSGSLLDLLTSTCLDNPSSHKVVLNSFCASALATPFTACISTQSCFNCKYADGCCIAASASTNSFGLGPGGAHPRASWSCLNFLSASCRMSAARARSALAFPAAFNHDAICFIAD